MPDYVTSARGAAQNAQGVAADFASKSFTIGDELKRAVQEALDYNKDVLDVRSSALSEYLKAPSDASAMFGVQTFGEGEKAGQANPDFVWNPFERNKLINDFISTKEIPFMSANAILGAREGTIADTVTAGTNAFRAQAAAAQAAAETANTTYTNVLNEFLKGEELRQNERSLDIQEYSARRSGGGGGGFSEKDLYDQQQQKNKAYGFLAGQIGKEEGIHTESDLRGSIYGQGYDPNDPFFASLYSQLPQPKQSITIGQRLQPVTNFFGNALNTWSDQRMREHEAYKQMGSSVAGGLSDFLGGASSNIKKGFSNISSFLQGR